MTLVIKKLWPIITKEEIENSSQELTWCSLSIRSKPGPSYLHSSQELEGGHMGLSDLVCASL